MSLKATGTPQGSMTFVDFWLELMMILLFLTGADVLDDIMFVFTCPVGAMFKILLKSVEFEGIKNPLKD